jgi:peptide/nickel transport system substrate-binding protein
LRKLRWQIIVVLLALVAIGVLLLSQQPTSTSSPQEGEKPVAGGIYTEALVGSFGRLNPVLDAYNSTDFDIDRLIFSGLVQHDSRGVPHGDLAETWGISQDGKSYSFAIRPNATFHDGAPVTSEDVLYTIDLLRSPDLPIPDDLREFWGQVDVQVIDEKTIQFRLPEPFAPFLDYLDFGVLPKHLLEGYGPGQLVDAPFNLSPVGSGPFRLESVDAQDGNILGVTLRSYPDYYGTAPFLEKVIFRYYPDEASALAAYDRGEVLGVSQITQATLSEVLKKTDLNLFTSRLPRLSLVYLNLDEPGLPFFQDATVRRALLMGINRRWIADRLMGGQAIIAHGPILPDNWAYYEGTERIEFDLEGAVNLLKQAGYTIPAEGGNVRTKDGVPLSFELAYPEGELYAAIAQRIQQDWSSIGVQVDLIAVPYEQLISDYLEPREYQAVLADLNFLRSPDPDPYPFWHQAQITAGQNYSQWDDRQASEYLEQARVIDDFDQRLRRYRNFQVRFSSELPALPLFIPVVSHAVDQKVRGVTMGPLYDYSDRFANITDWHLLTSAVAQASGTATPQP